MAINKNKIYCLDLHNSFLAKTVSYKDNFECTALYNKKEINHIVYIFNDILKANLAFIPQKIIKHSQF